jgi:RNA polymerase sigma-70 factor (ECF subfamily)
MDMPASTIAGPAEALARLAAGRDAEAWAWLVDELGPVIRRTAGRLSDDPASADDAAQEALLVLRDRAGSFRPRLDPDADARRWILRVTANAALELRRTRQRARARDARAGAAVPVAGIPPSVVEREETARLVRDALATLREPERCAVVLRVVDGLGYDQIAAELRCPEGTAKARVSRGLDRLRERLGRRAYELEAGALAALLGSAAAPGALPAGAHALIHSGAAARVAAIPTTGGLSMAIKCSLVLAAAIAIGAPIALHAQSSDGGAAAPARSPAPPGAAGDQGALPGSTPAAARPGATTAGRRSVDLDGALARHVTLDLEDSSLADAAALLGPMTGIVIRVDPAVSAAATVTLKLTDQTLAQAMERICALTGTRYVRTGEGLRFVSATPDAGGAAPGASANPAPAPAPGAAAGGAAPGASANPAPAPGAAIGQGRVTPQ